MAAKKVATKVVEADLTVKKSRKRKTAEKAAVMQMATKQEKAKKEVVKKTSGTKKKINSRDKGAAGERELAGELNYLFGTAARRGQQFNGLEGEDVVGLDGVHVESKRVETLNIHKAIEQAVKDSKGLKVPAVFHRKNRTPWLVTVRLNDLIKFAECIHTLAKKANRQQKKLSPVVESTSVSKSYLKAAYDYL